VGGSDAAVETPTEVWIIDTCSIIHIRRSVASGEQRRVYAALTKLVTSGNLVFPREVYWELERNKLSDRPDPPFEWARENVDRATRHGTDFDKVKAALKKTPKVLDPEKTVGSDEADPYVLGLALQLTELGHETTMITEERHDRPQKMSLNTACGLHRLVCVPILAFLSSREIWSAPE
jgi:hypothetical protein